MVDGNNENPQKYGISVAVEPGAARPFSPEVRQAVTAFVTALVRRVSLHPDCVLAMEEIPYTNPHEADLDERALAAAARTPVPLPPVDGHLTIVTAQGEVRVAYERRATPAGIAVGMMLRRRFDGEDRGMLFEYPHADYRYFWMFNCWIPIDLAYVREGKIEQIEAMVVQVDPKRRPRSEEWRRYESDAAVKLVLEMPAGWFERRGVKTGDPMRME
jgi:uncharacterized membrane protein (UPF0127 family)